LALVLLLLAGCAGLYWGIFAPPPQAADLAGRRPPARPVSQRVVQAVPIAVAGEVLTESGLPAAGLEMGLVLPGEQGGEDLVTGVTDAEGRFAHRLPHSGSFTVLRIPSEPGVVEIEQTEEDLLFIVPDLCPLRVEVLDQAGAPLSGAWIAARVRGGHQATEEDPGGIGRRWRTGWVFRGRSDEAGLATIETAPCGEARARVSADGYAPQTSEAHDTRLDPLITVRLAAGVLVDGLVSETDGAPIEGATVHLGAQETPSDAEGYYALWVKPGLMGEVTAMKTGYLVERKPLRLPEDDGATIDLVLQRERHVEVYCAGLPDDSCRTVEPGIMCTQPAVMLGPRCRPADPLRCTCPQGAAAIRGGGEVVRVAADDEVAWLDFRGRGGVEGVALLDGQPVPARVEVFRVPDSLLEELPRGLLAAQKDRCESDGSFRVDGLKPGTWRVSLQHSGEDLTLPEVTVRGGMTDVGELELSSGGVIQGWVLDGLTGQGKRSIPIWCTLDGEGFTVPAGFDNSDRDGAFEITGLPDGRYLLYPFPHLWARVEVDVVGGSSQDVEIWLGDDALPADQGFELVTGGAGELVADAVAPDSPAAQAGLEAGDVVQSAKLYGVDLGLLHQSLSHALLEHYAGPGVVLVVERDGSQLEVALD